MNSEGNDSPMIRGGKKYFHFPWKILIITIFFHFFTVPFTDKPTLVHAQTHALWANPGAPFAVRLHGTLYAFCSVGFPAKDAHGNRYFLTAGHCFRDSRGNHVNRGNHIGAYIYAAHNDETLASEDPIGEEWLHSTISHGNGFIDVSLVKLYLGETVHGGSYWIIRHSTEEPAHIGERICMVGFKENHPLCGSVTALNQYNHYRQYPIYSIHLVKATYVGHEGDSGGAVYSKTGAVGIHVSAGATGGSYFVPLDYVLTLLRKNIPTLTIL